MLGRLLILQLACCGVASAAATSEFSRRAEFLPLTMTRSELKQVVSRVRALAGGDLGTGGIDFESLAFTVGESETQFETGFALDEIDRAPENPHTVTYSLILHSKPVSHVFLQLGDHSRSLRVDGASPDHVTALFVAVEGDLRKSDFRVGGSGFRFVILMTLNMLAIWILLSSRARKLIPNRIPLGVLTFQAVAFGSSFLLPWETWFAGFKLESDSVSWVIRYSPEITLLGTVLGAIGLVFTILPFLRGGAIPPNTTPSTQSNGTGSTQTALPRAPPPIDPGTD